MKKVLNKNRWMYIYDSNQNFINVMIRFRRLHLSRDEHTDFNVGANKFLHACIYDVRSNTRSYADSLSDV